MLLSRLRKNIIKIFLVSVMLTAFWSAYSLCPPDAESGQQRKVVVIAVDRIGINDIVKEKVPNLRHLMAQGGTGLMNVRGSSFRWENRESGYLSLNMGRRASYPEDAANAGGFGRTAREKGLKIAVIDKTGAAKPRREALLLAADEQGNVPFTATGGSDDALLAEFRRLYEAADIIIVNYGEGPGALADTDAFLGRVTALINKNITMLMVITPNPPAEMVRGNFSLTPVVVTGPGLDEGILTTNTTKRPGLIANVDFVPAVMSHFGIKELPGYVGEPVGIKKVDDPLNHVLKDFDQYKNLKISRYIIHSFYATVTVLALLVIYLPVLGRRPVTGPTFTRALALSVFTLPMMNYLLSPLLDFSRSYLFTFLIVFSAFLIGYLFSRWSDDLLLPLGLISLFTSLTLLTGIFFGGNIHLDSPLGYADVFVGGRYYGMGNDTMGIMLGASVLGTFALFQSFRFSRAAAVAAGFIYMALPVIGLSPPFGANVGGTIAAMVVATLSVAVLAGGKPVSWRHILFIVALVFAVEVGIAYLDAFLNTRRTHAGNVLADLMAGNFPAKFLHVLWSKLSLFLLMLVVPPWNLILFGEYYLVYKMYRQGAFGRLYESYSHLARGFTVMFFGGVVAFLFNDTGVIATAMMYTYLLIPLGLLASGSMRKDGR